MMFAERVILVTGAGSGIGRALCLALAAHNPKHVVCVDLDLAGAEETVRQYMSKKNSLFASAVKCDVSAEAEVIRLIDNAVASHGSVDFFFANAGIVGAMDKVNPVASDEEIQKVIQVNFSSQLFAARHLVPMWTRDHRENGGHGTLVFTASMAGLLNVPFSLPYALSKAMSVSLAESLSMHYGKEKGVHVAVAVPGFVQTNIGTSASLSGDTPGGIDPRLESTIMDAETCADLIIQGVAEGKFLISPHKHVIPAFQFKAKSYDKWIDSYRRFVETDTRSKL